MTIFSLCAWMILIIGIAAYILTTPEPYFLIVAAIGCGSYMVGRTK